MLMKIISGGQTGVDIAGLKVAKALGFDTGGWMPKGWKTLDGPKPEYEKLYGMKEHSSNNYKERTWDNVFDADATLRIAVDFNSAGERCTLKAIKAYVKPSFDIHLVKWNNYLIMDTSPYCFYDWLDVHKPNVLNVAGNSEQTSPGIHEASYFYLHDLLKRLVQAPSTP